MKMQTQIQIQILIQTQTQTQTQKQIQIQNTNDDECCRGSPPQIAGIKAKDASKRWQRLPEASIKDRQPHLKHGEIQIHVISRNS